MEVVDSVERVFIITIIKKGTDFQSRNPFFKKKVSLEEQKTQKEDRFLCAGQIALMIYDNFRVTGARTVLDNADLFSVQRNSIIHDQFPT